MIRLLLRDPPPKRFTPGGLRPALSSLERKLFIEGDHTYEGVKHDAGYPSVTIKAARGLPLLCPRLGGFDFRPGGPDRPVCRCE